jgi:hypothetical protein
MVSKDEQDLLPGRLTRQNAEVRPEDPSRFPPRFYWRALFLPIVW